MTQRDIRVVSSDIETNKNVYTTLNNTGKFKFDLELTMEEYFTGEPSNNDLKVLVVVTSNKEEFQEPQEGDHEQQDLELIVSSHKKDGQAIPKKMKQSFIQNQFKNNKIRVPRLVIVYGRNAS